MTSFLAFIYAGEQMLELPNTGIAIVRKLYKPRNIKYNRFVKQTIYWLMCLFDFTGFHIPHIDGVQCWAFALRADKALIDI